MIPMMDDHAANGEAATHGRLRTPDVTEPDAPFRVNAAWHRPVGARWESKPADISRVKRALSR